MRGAMTACTAAGTRWARHTRQQINEDQEHDPTEQITVGVRIASILLHVHSEPVERILAKKSINAFASILC